VCEAAPRLASECHLNISVASSIESCPQRLVLHFAPLVFKDHRPSTLSGRSELRIGRHIVSCTLDKEEAATSVQAIIL
jgi:hypothetical protein